MNLDDLPESLREFAVLMIIIIALLAFDFFYSNPYAIWLVIGVTVVGAGVYFYFKHVKSDIGIGSYSAEPETPLNSNESQNEFVHALKNKLKSFRPVVTRNYNESVFEGQLYQYLGQAFPKSNVAYQSNAKSGRVDIVVDKKWAIELKLASSKKQLETSFLQFLKYAEEFECLFVVVHDVNKKLQKSSVNDLLKECRKSGRSNIDFIILH